MNNTKKNFVWNMIGTTLNAFNSLFFMIIATRVNGVKDAGIFTFAFTTATLFNIIGVYSGRVYQVTDRSKANDKDFIISKIITCLLMMLVSILFVTINNYNSYKSIIILLLCFLKMLEAFSETFYAIFQKNDELYITGISYTLKSLINLFTFLIVDILTHNLILSITGMIITYLLIFAFYDMKKIKNIIQKKDRYKIENIKNILIKGLSAFIISFLILYLINSSKYIMDFLLNEESQTIFGILLMPATVILLFTQFIINPFLNTITDCIKKKDYSSLKKIIYKFLVVMLIFGVLILIAAKLLGIPVLEFIYGIELSDYKYGFLFIMCGAVLYGMSSILSNILIAMRHLRTQVVTYSFVSVIITLIGYYLIKSHGIIGACYSYFFMTLIIFVLFYIITFIFIRKDGKE